MNVITALADLVAEINEQHKLAHASAETAVEHALRCGGLLLDVKRKLTHGQFQSWVEANCEFAWSTAKRYCLASRQKATGVAFSSLRGLFPSGRVQKPAPRLIPQTRSDNNVSHAIHLKRATDPNESADWDDDESAALERAEKDCSERFDKAMADADPGGELRAQIQQQAALLGKVTISRDGYQNRCGELTRLLRKEQSKTVRLLKRIEQLESENEKLRERVAIMEEAA